MISERLAQIIAPMLLRDGHNGTMVPRDDDQLASDVARWLLVDEDARRLTLDASTADVGGHPDVALRTHRDGRVLIEVPTGLTHPLLERAWVLIKPDPDGAIRWAHFGEYNDPEFAERVVLSPMDGPPHRCYPGVPDQRHQQRRGLHMSDAVKTVTMKIPTEVADAAERLRSDIRQAIDVCYGELGGKADTPEDVAGAERAIAADMAAVLDWITEQEYKEGA